MKLRTLALSASLFLPLLALAADPPPVEIKTTAIAGSVSMLEGAGGNIGVSSGPDGQFMIDDQYAGMGENIRKALAALGPQPLRFLVNTHWHGDHTGGNEGFGKTGAVIVAQDNVRKRMSTEQFIKMFDMRTPAAPAIALPVITFSESVSFHLNGDDIDVIHVAPAHTDGDSIVWFHKANVIHAGDTFFNGIYPFIDVSSGGSINGQIAAAERILGLGDEHTKIIPGHGPLADRAALRAYRDMLAKVRDRIAPLAKAGKTLDQVLATKPTAEFDAPWGKGFLKPEQFVAMVYASLTAAP